MVVPKTLIDNLLPFNELQFCWLKELNDGIKTNNKGYNACANKILAA